jgi:hypothetical protein
MKIRVLLFVLVLLAGGAVAQAPPAPPAKAPPVPAEVAPGDDKNATAVQDPDAAPPPPAAAKGSPQRFEPTERVRPDFDVAFPVDI